MKAKYMHTNQQLVIVAGESAGTMVEVIDPAPVPDGMPNQRKVKVRFEGEQDDTYILPKLLGLPGQAKKEFMVVDSGRFDGTVLQGSPITDPMDDALDEFRPDPSIITSYVPRTMPNGMKDIDYLMALRNERNSDGYIENLALVGDTQAGKTMLVRCLAVISAQQDGLPKPYPIFTLNGSQGISNYELFGQPSAVVIDNKEVIVWMDGYVPLAAMCGGFLYLDEWNAVPAGQATALHPVLDDRREFSNLKKAVPNGHGGWRPETIKLNKNLWTITTVNPVGYRGVQAMAEASTNRFRWVNWGYDEEVEKALVPSATIRALGIALREAREQRALSLPIGTSALQRYTKDIANFGYDMATMSLIAMYPPNEQERVRAILTDRGYENLLRAEYPTPKYGTAPAQTEDQF